MPYLWKNDNTKTVNDEETLNETRTFYERLYSNKPNKDCMLENILHHRDIPKLSETEKLSLEGPLTLNETLNALKNMKNNRSPGSDGFTTEFLKKFWIDIGKYLLRALNYGFEYRELSSTQKEGVIICLPKGQKDKHYLKNWRPISLLNVSYKIASAVTANRLKTILLKLIHEDQTGSILGRFIGENIRTLYDLMFYCEKQSIPGLLLLIDFEKAFDSIALDFIYKVLTFLNFGPSLITWIKVFYKNIKSCVIINGKASSFFNIYRGCRQGDRLSPYIFILCAEILAHLIRKNDNVKGITVNDKEFLASQYADDTTLIILDGSEESLKTCLSILKFYADTSGLHINMEKIRVIMIGSKKGSEEQLCTETKLNWDQKIFTVLGIIFSINLQEMIDINYSKAYKEIKNVLIQWS